MVTRKRGVRCTLNNYVVDIARSKTSRGTTYNLQIKMLQSFFFSVFFLRHPHHQLTKTRVEALRLENSNLQEVRALDVSSTSRDLQQAEIQLQELQQLHRQHVQWSKILEVDDSQRVCSLT